MSQLAVVALSPIEAGANNNEGEPTEGNESALFDLKGPRVGSDWNITQINLRYLRLAIFFGLLFEEINPPSVFPTPSEAFIVQGSITAEVSLLLDGCAELWSDSVSWNVSRKLPELVQNKKDVEKKVNPIRRQREETEVLAQPFTSTTSGLLIPSGHGLSLVVGLSVTNTSKGKVEAGPFNEKLTRKLSAALLTGPSEQIGGQQEGFLPPAPASESKIIIEYENERRHARH